MPDCSPLQATSRSSRSRTCARRAISARRAFRSHRKGCARCPRRATSATASCARWAGTSTASSRAIAARCCRAVASGTPARRGRAWGSIPPWTSRSCSRPTRTIRTTRAAVPCPSSPRSRASSPRACGTTRAVPIRSRPRAYRTRSSPRKRRAARWVSLQRAAPRRRLARRRRRRRRRDPVMNALLAAVLATALAAGSDDEVVQRVHARIVGYDVAAPSCHEVFAGVPEPGSAVFDFRSRIRGEPQGGRYTGKVEFSLGDVTIHLPKSIAWKGMNVGDRERASALRRAIYHHEVGHVRIAEAVRDALNAASPLTAPDYFAFGAAADAIGRDGFERFKREEREYDALTDHGRKQEAAPGDLAGPNTLILCR